MAPQPPTLLHLPGLAAVLGPALPLPWGAVTPPTRHETEDFPSQPTHDPWWPIPALTRTWRLRPPSHVMRGPLTPPTQSHAWVAAWVSQGSYPAEPKHRIMVSQRGPTRESRDHRHLTRPELRERATQRVGKQRVVASRRPT